MRRLLLLVSVLVFVDTMLYAALTPLLARFVHEFHLSKGSAGVLVAAFAAGALVGALPGGVAAVRLGARRAVLLGVALMGLASLGFAFAGSFAALFAARLLQGGGSAFTWAGAFAWLLAAAPRERRGELLGVAMGAAVFGALFGPVLGALAAFVGRDVAFSALAAVALVLAAWTVRQRTPARVHASRMARRASFANARLLAGLGLMALGALLFGVLAVLAPLRLSAAGWGAGAIGAVWLLGAAIETAESPLLGRMVDRRGPLVPVRAALAGGALLSIGLATGARPLLYAPLVIGASIAYGALFTPAFAMIADGAEQAGIAQGIAFGLMNATWALGAMVGPAAGGALAGATSDWVPFVAAAALCAATLAAVRARPEARPLGALSGQG